MDGYYSKTQCENIKKIMTGKTFMKFQISYSSCAGNCTLIVKTDIENYSIEEIKEMFIYACISEFANTI